MTLFGWSRLVAVVAVVLLALGCGGAESTFVHSSKAETVEPLPADPANGHGNASSSGSAPDAPPPVTVTQAESADARFPAAAQMGVFTRTRTPDDVLPAEWRGNAGSLRDEHVGAALIEQSRLLLPNLGEPGVALYAAPTSRGAVCFYWFGGAGGCVEDLDANRGVTFMGIDPDLEGTGAPGAVVGVVSDRVSSAAVAIGDTRLEAIVSNNGFFVELPSSGCSMTAVKSVLVSNQDGTEAEVAVEWHSSAPTPGSCM